jgi:hypothetical protein
LVHHTRTGHRLLAHGRWSIARTLTPFPYPFPERR